MEDVDIRIVENQSQYKVIVIIEIDYVRVNKYIIYVD